MELVCYDNKRRCSSSRFDARWMKTPLQSQDVVVNMNLFFFFFYIVQIAFIYRPTSAAAPFMESTFFLFFFFSPRAALCEF